MGIDIQKGGPSCELMHNEMHFYGGRSRRLKKANCNHVKYAEDDLNSTQSDDAVGESELVKMEESGSQTLILSTSTNNSHKNREFEHNSHGNKSPSAIQRRNSLDKNESRSSEPNNTEGENAGMNKRGSLNFITKRLSQTSLLTHPVREKISNNSNGGEEKSMRRRSLDYMQRTLSGLSIEAISDAVSEIGSTHEQHSHSNAEEKRMTKRLSGLSISTAVSELADQFMGAFEHETDQCSEVSFPVRRTSVSLNLNDGLDIHDDLSLNSDPSIASIGSKLAEKKFHLASIDTEKDKIAMEIRDNNAVLSQLQEQVLEKGDKNLYEKYENLDIEVYQLRESFEALLNEIHENDENNRKYMEQTELLHAIYETITNATVKRNPCAGRKSS